LTSQLLHPEVSEYWAVKTFSNRFQILTFQRRARVHLLSWSSRPSWFLLISDMGCRRVSKERLDPLRVIQMLLPPYLLHLGREPPILPLHQCHRQRLIAEALSHPVRQ
jgi:hypothetical protein